MIFKAGKHSWDLDSGPLIMGILNITPDSFSDGGRYLSLEKAIAQGKSLWEEGADIVDIGGESTRPGAEPVPVNDELARVIPVVETLVEHDIPCSIDTYKSEVAEAALASGACIVNDISGLRYDESMAEVTAKYEAGLIIMHIKGTPRNMQVNPVYDDLLGEIMTYLLSGADKARAAGVGKESIILDPGIGFGKTLDNNLEIIRNVRSLKKSGYAVMIGASRKSFIGKLLDNEVDDRLFGTVGACVTAVLNGADMLRVHDPKAVGEAVRVAVAIQPEPAAHAV